MSEENTVTGSCLCGTVSYEVSGGISDIIHCHCVTCRKAHGSAFSSVASVKDEGFHLTGGDNLTGFESSPGKTRYFCKTCGTQVYAKRIDKNHVILRLGSIDAGIPGKELAHTWLADKAAWYNMDAGLPCFDEGYPRG